MDEDAGWSLSMPAVERSLAEARGAGATPKALVIINPGNPVGSCLSYDNLVDLVRLCRRERLVLIADEVYQDNVYGDRSPAAAHRTRPCRWPAAAHRARRRRWPAAAHSARRRARRTVHGDVRKSSSRERAFRSLLTTLARKASSRDRASF